MDCNCELNVNNLDNSFNMCVGQVEVHKPKPNPDKNVQFDNYEDLPIPGNPQMLYFVINEDTIYRWDEVNSKYEPCGKSIDNIDAELVYFPDNLVLTEKFGKYEPDATGSYLLFTSSQR